MKSVEVSEYLQTKLITVRPSMNVYEAAQKIMENKVSGVAVVDENNNLVGMQSELDCLRAIVSAVYNGNSPGAALVEDVMTKDVEMNKPGDAIIDVDSLM